jgi:catechol 2,3-dioxygenase-like lactoylglutathione lyase family enzyme
MNGDQAKWSIEHISAVTVAVLEMSESVAFYRKLGLDVSYGGPDAPFTTMRAGQSVINLRRVPTRTGDPWSRVILRVRGVDALHRHFVEQGLRPTAPMDADWGERYFEVPDPQGVVISFAEELGPLRPPRAERATGSSDPHGPSHRQAIRGQQDE